MSDLAYKELLRATKHEIKLAKKENRKKVLPLGEKETEVMNDLNNLGYHIIPNFYSEEKCALIKAEINRLHNKHKDMVWSDDLGSDKRLFGANRDSELISEFYNNTFIKNLTAHFEGTENYTGYTMAAEMNYKEGNLGSGGGWHRDRADERQLKVILYLSEVNEKNGPFQYYEGSHTPTAILQSVLLHGFKHNQRRFTDEEIESLDKNYLRTAIGNIGSLLIADVRGIHRGMPMLEGERTILMNYSWPHPIPKHIRKMVIK